ncbi:hypothetical protein Patl1_33746 [Pistacia atlantica]|uniref:Uncharacterized protein n=1 Tax=Pistacia atlantica TaxID=434234 RepID=A0ACC0ZPY9_9ROSI|nr:hypothetical protein Patl1_33746 [Pistacia atlantica]
MPVNRIGSNTWSPDAMEGPTPDPLRFMHTMSYDVMPCWQPRNITRRSKEGHSLFNLHQLGYMIFACGISNYSVSVFHLMNHAFFKALLFPECVR